MIIACKKRSKKFEIGGQLRTLPKNLERQDTRGMINACLPEASGMEREEFGQGLQGSIRIMPDMPVVEEPQEGAGVGVYERTRIEGENIEMTGQQRRLSDEGRNEERSGVDWPSQAGGTAAEGEYEGAAMGGTPKPKGIEIRNWDEMPETVGSGDEELLGTVDISAGPRRTMVVEEDSPYKNDLGLRFADPKVAFLFFLQLKMCSLFKKEFYRSRELSFWQDTSSI